MSKVIENFLKRIDDRNRTRSLSVGKRQINDDIMFYLRDVLTLIRILFEERSMRDELEEMKNIKGHESTLTNNEILIKTLLRALKVVEEETHDVIQDKTMPDKQKLKLLGRLNLEFTKLFEMVYIL